MAPSCRQPARNQRRQQPTDSRASPPHVDDRTRSGDTEGSSRDHPKSRKPQALTLCAMATAEETIRKAEALFAQGRRKEPQQLLTDLMQQMSDTALSDWRADLLKMIDKFLPKQRQELLQLLDRKTDRKTAAPPSLVRESATASYPASATSVPPGDLPGEDAFREDLAILSERHIFQWSSHYDACLTRHFDGYLAHMKQAPVAEHYAESARRMLQEHAREIFSKGYGFQMERVGQSMAMQKSIGGLARFLELLLAYYSARSSDAVDRKSVQTLRALFSFSLLGIIQGIRVDQVRCRHGRCRTSKPL